jgi:hypothetical protein
MFKILNTYICLKKYIKCNIWRVAVCPSYIQDAWLLKVKGTSFLTSTCTSQEQSDCSYKILSYFGMLFTVKIIYFSTCFILIGCSDASGPINLSFYWPSHEQNITVLTDYWLHLPYLNVTYPWIRQKKTVVQYLASFLLLGKKSMRSLSCPNMWPRPISHQPNYWFSQNLVWISYHGKPSHLIFASVLIVLTRQTHKVRNTDAT